MGLELPLALLGLLAGVLPWLAHRIRRRDLTPVPLPTFALLREAEARKRRSRGLTDVLLLCLRVAILAIAALALAAPYVTARLSFGDGNVASAAIVIDDSMSMQRRDGGDTLLHQAVEQAERAIASLPPGSEIALVLGGARARVLLRKTNELALARAELARVPETSVRATDLTGAIQLAAQQLENARHPVRRMLVLSDFASHTRLRAEDVKLSGVQVTLERLGDARAFNVYFASARALPDPGTRGLTSIALELAASGPAPTRVPVKLLSSGRELGSVEIAIEGGRGRGTLHVKTPPEGSDPTAQLRIAASDALDADNTAGVLLRQADALQVMLVDGDPQPGTDRDELYYAKNALRLAPGDRGQLALRSVDENAVDKYELTRTDVVVLANAHVPSKATVDRLVRFVQGGGGLIVTAGDHVEAKPYDAALRALLPCRVRARTLGADIGFAPPGDQRLLPGPQGLEQAKTRGRLVLDCAADVLLRFADGTPAVAVANVGKGRSALVATTLDDEWTDLPLRPGYLPLLSQLIWNVARAGEVVSGPVAAGTSVKLGVPPETDELEVLTPSGDRHRLKPKAAGEGVTFAETFEAGAYRVLAAGRRGNVSDSPRGAFVVESPRVESDLTLLSSLPALASSTPTDARSATIKQGLAPYLLLVFALLVLAEGALRLRKS